MLHRPHPAIEPRGRAEIERDQLIRRLCIGNDADVPAGGGELGAVRAKMQCNFVESTKHSATYTQHKVKLGAVCSEKGENKDFADATPSGECWMQISDGRPALGYFKPGKKYYVTFTEAPD